MKIIDLYKAVARNPLFRMTEPVTLSIEEGEQLAIIGENGTGKTTLIKLLMRLYDIDSGKITIDGVNINF